MKILHCIKKNCTERAAPVFSSWPRIGIQTIFSSIAHLQSHFVSLNLCYSFIMNRLSPSFEFKIHPLNTH